MSIGSFYPQNTLLYQKPTYLQYDIVPVKPEIQSKTEKSADMLSSEHLKSALAGGIITTGLLGFGSMIYRATVKPPKPKPFLPTITAQSNDILTSSIFAGLTIMASLGVSRFLFNGSNTDKKSLKDSKKSSD